jgi:hypothetical protein
MPIRQINPILYIELPVLTPVKKFALSTATLASIYTSNHTKFILLSKISDLICLLMDYGKASIESLAKSDLM